MPDIAISADKLTRSLGNLPRLMRFLSKFLMGLFLVFWGPMGPEKAPPSACSVVF